MKQVLKTLLLLLSLLAGLYACKSESPYPDIQQLSYTLINGKRLSMRELKGQPVIVTFWATSCAACIKEIPDLIRLYKKYSHHGLEIIAVATPNNRPDHVLEFSKEYNLPYRVALDVDAKIIQAFGNVRITPNNFLIDTNGKIIKQHIGILNMAKIDKWLQSTLSKGKQ